MTVSNMTPPPTQGPSDMDIALGESASVCNISLTKEHISKLREMVATKDKLKRFLCTSAEEDGVIPNKLIKVSSSKKDEARCQEQEEGERREFQVITYTGFFTILPKLSSSYVSGLSYAITLIYIRKA